MSFLRVVHELSFLAKLSINVSDEPLTAEIDLHELDTKTNSAGDYTFKVNNRNTKRRCEICSKLKIKTPERYC